MKRWLFTAASLLLLVICASVLWLLVRHGRMIGDHHEIFTVIVESRHARYTLRADADRLSLCAPPLARPVSSYQQPIPGYVEADPRPIPMLLSLMRNDNVVWEFMHYEEQEEGDEQLSLETICFGADTIRRHNRLVFTDEGLLIPGLLEALEDPKRAVAAHTMLAERLLHRTWKLPRRPGGAFTFDFDGMKINFSPLGQPHVGVTPGGLVNIYEPSWGVDPSQFPALCAQWHGRLDRRFMSVTYARAAITTSIMPAIWLALWIRGRRLR